MYKGLRNDSSERLSVVLSSIYKTGILPSTTVRTVTQAVVIDNLASSSQINLVKEMEQKEIDPESPSTTMAASGLIDDHQTIRGKGETSEPKMTESRMKKFAARAAVVSAFLLQMAGFGYSSSFGVFQDFYVREYLTRSTSSQISWIGSVQTFSMLVMGVFAGRMFDRGYCYHLVISGSIISIFSLFMLSLAQPEQYYQVFLAQGLGVGIGSGLSYTPSVAVIAQHFREPYSRARAMGIAVSGVSIGGLVHPIYINSLLHRKEGMGPDEIRKAFVCGTRASAGLITGLQVIGVLLLRTKYPKADETRSTEEARGKDVTELQRMNFIGTVIKFATDWPYVCFVIGMMLYELVFFFPLFYLQLYSIQHGLDAGFAFYSVSIINGASFLGRLVPGFFARTLGVTNMLLVSTASATILMFCMLAARTVAGVASFASLYGFFSGAFISLVNPVLALLAEHPSEIGARMGMCFALSAFGSLTGTPIAGALLTSEFIWWRPIVLSGCTCVIGFLLFATCRIILGKRKGGSCVI